jgi:hypothetical protein
MTHAVLPKSEPSPTSPSLPNTLQMDPQQSQHAVPHPPAQPARKRKKNDVNDEPAEPRRLRRSHEACARCRSKKIKASAVAPDATGGNFHLQLRFAYREGLFFKPSATPNIQDAPLAPTLALHAIKRTDTGRLSLQEDILSASSAN